MFGSLVLVNLLAFAASELCDCDTAKTHITGTTCNVCETGWMSDPAALPNAPLVCDFQCTASTDCNSNGVCTYKDDCTCFARFLDTSKTCTECADGLQNYPSCNQASCDPTTTCGGVGSCVEPLKSCGPISCGDGFKCYEWKASKDFWDTNGGTPVWTRKGEFDFRCVPEASTGCGRRSAQNCPQGAICAKENLGICQTIPADPEALDKDDSLCLPLFENGTIRRTNSNNQNSGAQGNTCLSWQTCCDGVCCNQYQTCAEIGELLDGFVNTATGEKLGYTPMTCTNYQLVADAGMRVVLPFASIATALIALALVFKRVGFPSERFIGIPAYVAVALNIILLFNEFWQNHLVIILGLFFVLTTTVSNNPRRFKYALMVEVLAFTIYAGRNASFVGVLFQSAANNGAFEPFGGSTGNPYANVGRLQGRCASFYNYFWRDPATLAWDSDSTDTYFGLCSMGMMSFTSVMQQFLLVDFLVLIAGTGFVIMDTKSK